MSSQNITVFLVTFIITVFVDLTVAIEVGLGFAAFFFIKKMIDLSEVQDERASITGGIHKDQPSENLDKLKIEFSIVFSIPHVLNISIPNVNGGFVLEGSNYKKGEPLDIITPNGYSYYYSDPDGISSSEVLSNYISSYMKDFEDALIDLLCGDNREFFLGYMAVRSHVTARNAAKKYNKYYFDIDIEKVVNCLKTNLQAKKEQDIENIEINYFS